MQKIKHFTCFYHSVLFFCSKRCKIQFNTLFDYENYNRKVLQNIAINHSADIDYKDFMKTYRECTKEPFNFLTILIDIVLFLTIDTNPLRFKKILFDPL